MGLPSSVTDRQFLKPVRSPVYSLLVGWILSLLVGHSAGDSGWMLILIPAAVPAFLFGDGLRRSFRWVLLGFCFGWPWLCLRSEKVPIEWELLPQREAVLEIEIIRLFSVRREERFGGIGLIVAADPALIELKGHRVSFYLETDQERDELYRGRRFEALGVLRYLPANPDPDGFQRYLESQDVHLSLQRGRVRNWTDDGPVSARVFHQLRLRVREYLLAGAGPDRAQAVVLPAMMLGERVMLEPEREERFARSGSLHLFAISGLHVMAVAATLAQVLALTRLPPGIVAVVGLTGVWVYVMMTGHTPSAVRAFTMVAFFWGAKAFLRQSNSFGALANSALAVLILDPRQLWLPGFQLSYMVVGGLVTVAALLEVSGRGMIDRPTWREEQFVPRAFKVRLWMIRQALRLFFLSLTASLFSAPLIISFFGLFSPVAVFLNMVLVPLAGLVVSTGCLVIVLGLAGFDSLAIFYNHAAWIAIGSMEWSIEVALSMPGTWHERHWPHHFIGPVLSFGSLVLAAFTREACRRDHCSVPFAVGAPMVLLFLGILLGSVPGTP